jgi:serine/threonine protein kinase
MTLFSKKKGVEVCLDDFKIRKVLGKGSFGKVFLVEKNDDGTPYAMKALRKDVLIDYD